MRLRQTVFSFCTCLIFLTSTICISKENEVSHTSSKKIQPLNIPFKPQGSLQLIRAGEKKPATQITIELAETILTRMKGLMYRDTLEKNQGMLFVFDQPKATNFYMRNTFIPLDIIFFDENRNVISIGEGIPFSEALVPSNGPCLYVLEVNRGFAKHHKIKIGDHMEWMRY